MKEEILDGQKLKAVRNMLRLYQKEMADILGVSKSTIDRWERKNMKLSKLVRIALQELMFDPDRVDMIKMLRPKRKGGNDRSKIGQIIMPKSQ